MSSHAFFYYEKAHDNSPKGRYTSKGRGEHNRQEGSDCQASPADDQKSLRKAETPVYHGQWVLLIHRFVRRISVKLYGRLIRACKTTLTEPRFRRGSLFWAGQQYHFCPVFLSASSRPAQGQLKASSGPDKRPGNSFIYYDKNMAGLYISGKNGKNRYSLS